MERFSVLDAVVVDRIAALLGCDVQQATYSAGDAPVYELRLAARANGEGVLLVLWPGLRRADVRAGGWSLVFKRIDAIELYPGVEVLFRRADPPGYLFITPNGIASMCV